MKKIGFLHVRDAQKYYVGSRVFFPRRSWLGRAWQRIKILFRIGGYMTVTQVDHERGEITVTS